MCGRFRLGKGREALRKHFGSYGDLDWSPRYNIAPTQPIPTVRQNASEPKREVSLMHWGLIPSWAKDGSVGASMINARSETAAHKPAFRDSLSRRRCLIPADGFYEWKALAKVKQPYCFRLRDGSLFAFAGIWDRWRSRDGTAMESCSILTTTPNALCAAVHDRMPVILSPQDYDVWLDPGFTSIADLAAMLKPYTAGEMLRFPVTARVNKVQNDDPQCCEAVAEAAKAAEVGGQRSLFG